MHPGPPRGDIFCDSCPAPGCVLTRKTRAWSDFHEIQVCVKFKWLRGKKPSGCLKFFIISEKVGNPCRPRCEYSSGFRWGFASSVEITKSRLGLLYAVHFAKNVRTKGVKKAWNNVVSSDSFRIPRNPKTLILIYAVLIFQGNSMEFWAGHLLASYCVFFLPAGEKNSSGRFRNSSGRSRPGARDNRAGTPRGDFRGRHHREEDAPGDLQTGDDP